MIAAIPIDPDGTVGPRWGRAERVAIAHAVSDRIALWEEHDVAWDSAHDEGTEGAHHARVARFLREHHVDTVIAGHMGDGISRMLTTMGVSVALGAAGDAREQVLAALAQPAESSQD